MNRTLVVIPVVLALGVGAWLVTRPRPTASIDVDAQPAATEPIVRAPDAASVRPSTGLSVAPARPAPRVERTSGPARVYTGSLTVTVVAPEGAALSPLSMSLDASPVGSADPGKPLPTLGEDGAWRYESITAGRWRIRVFAAGYRDVAKEVDVPRDGAAALSIPLDRGASASFKVSLLAGAEIDSVRLALLDAKGTAREATFQLAHGTVHVAPGASQELPPSGTLIGLEPGTYRLRATSPAGETNEERFTVALGETADVQITLRR